jgi:Flp pilus assembly protein TadB
MVKVISLLVLTGAGFLAWGVAAPISSLAVAGVILLAVGILLMRYAR